MASFSFFLICVLSAVFVLSASQGCDWVKFQGCTAPMTGLESEKNLTILCPKLETGDNCLLALQAECADQQILDAINATLTSMRTGLDACRGECSWLRFQECSDVMAGTETEQDPNIFCPKLQKGKHCLDKMKMDCSDQTLLENVNNVLAQVEPYLGLCPQVTTTPAHHDCEWAWYEKCTSPMAGLENRRDWDNICPILKEGKKCLDEIVAHCAGYDVGNSARDHLTKMQPGIEACMHSTAEPHSSSCSWMGFEKCTSQISGLENEKDMSIFCPKMREGQRCLQDMLHHCHDGDILSNIRSVLSQMQPGLILCPMDQDCTKTHVDRCMEHLYMHDMTHQCRETERVKKCLYDLHRECKDMQMKDHISSDSIPNVERKIEECMMYGYETGSGSHVGDGHVQMPSSASRPAQRPLMVISMAAAMAIVGMLKTF